MSTQLEVENSSPEDENLSCCSKVWAETLRRVRRSRFYKTFYRPDEIAKTDVDEVMNTLSVVNALVFTIPFGMMGSFSTEAWDEYQTSLAASDCSGDYSVNEDVFSVATLMLISLYCSLAAILFSLCYYFSHPGNVEDDQDGEKLRKNFLAWWRRGRYCFLLLFLCTVCSVVGTVGVANMYYAIFMNPTSQLCDSGKRRATFKLLYSLVIIAFALMMLFLA